MLCETWRAVGSGQEVIAKRLRPELLPNARLEAWFQERHRALQGFVHSHAVRQRELVDDEVFTVLLEPLSGIPLTDYLDRHGPRVPWKVWRPWLHHALTALDALQAFLPGFVHGDIRPENLWLREPPPNDTDNNARHELVLMDLTGLAEPNAPGTFSSLSPHRARGNPANPDDDRFALAMLFYQLETGEHVYGNLDPGNPAAILKAAQGFDDVSCRVRLKKLPDGARCLLEPLLGAGMTNKQPPILSD